MVYSKPPKNTEKLLRFAIRQGKLGCQKSLAEAKVDLKDPSHIANRLYGYGPDISDKELEQFGTALLEPNAPPKEASRNCMKKMG